MSPEALESEETIRQERKADGSKRAVDILETKKEKLARVCNLWARWSYSTNCVVLAYASARQGMAGGVE